MPIYEARVLTRNYSNVNPPLPNYRIDFASLELPSADEYVPLTYRHDNRFKLGECFDFHERRDGIYCLIRTYRAFGEDSLKGISAELCDFEIDMGIMKNAVLDTVSLAKNPVDSFAQITRKIDDPSNYVASTIHLRIDRKVNEASNSLMSVISY